MPHIVLLGDSIFDNAAYTRGGPEVVAQVRQHLPSGWKATLLAVDGARTEDVADQLRRLPADATHLVLSVGGNDALMNASVLSVPVSSMTEAVGLLAEIASEFAKRYRELIEACLRLGLPLSVCTIYNGCFPDAAYQRVASTALMVFNDGILLLAIEHGLPVIDLRLVCADPSDYANPIEPSSVGGDKIARAIVALVTDARRDAAPSRIVSG
jgi:hypothetical protein